MDNILMPISADSVIQAMTDSARFRRQAVLRMKREQGLTYREIGEKLGVSRQRVHALCKLAIKDAERKQAVG